MSFELLSLETIQELARQYGYWSVFLGIALENTGIPLPGETLTLAAGFLAGSGELSYQGVFGCAIAGAVLGDNLGYWVGKLGGWPLVQSIGRFFKIDEEKLESTRERFIKNAPSAVFFGRFVALLRIFAGPLAGIANMSYPLFLACNLGGAVVWAGVTVTAAFFLGRLMPLAEVMQLVAKFGFVCLILAIAWIVIPMLWEARKTKIKTDRNPDIS